MQSIIQKKSYGSVKIFYLNRELLREKIEECIKKMVENCKEIKKVVLFGSFCKNKATVSSDIDLLVIVSSSKDRFIDRPLKYLKFFEDLGFDIDLFVYTEKELEKEIPLAKTAIKEGKVLFSRPD